jgi:hypothetical protein
MKEQEKQIESTSIHKLNADRNLNWPLKLAYICLNLANNALPNWLVDPKLKLTNFSTKGGFNNLGERSTLSRKFSNLFWREFDWKKLEQELKTINIFDVGCGAGDITERLYTEYAENRINSYKGVDVFPYPGRWRVLSKKYKGLRFAKIKSEKRILKEIPKKTNLIISQSSLEHVNNDWLVFKQIKEFTQASKHQVVQIHLVPSASCLWLYLFHGVRQYTPRTVSKITRLFSDSSCQLISFGGDRSFKLQWEAFTKPEIINRFDLSRFGITTGEWSGSNFNKIADKPKLINKYNKLAKEAMKKDMKNKGSRAVFYALVIKSNANEK